MLKKITFKKDHRCFKKGDVIKFRPGLNFLVGGQGTGKSTLLQLIGGSCGSAEKSLVAEHEDVVKKVAKLEFDDNKQEIIQFDSERSNVRTLGWFDDDIPFHIHAMNSSHGEGMIDQIARDLIDKETKKAVKNKLVLIDEPESGISIKNQIEIFNLFNRLASLNECQVIVSTHSIYNMIQVESLLCLDDNEWVDSQEYLRSQMTPEMQAHLLIFTLGSKKEKSKKEKSKKKGSKK